MAQAKTLVGSWKRYTTLLAAGFLVIAFAATDALAGCNNGNLCSPSMSGDAIGYSSGFGYAKAKGEKAHTKGWKEGGAGTFVDLKIDTAGNNYGKAGAWGYENIHTEASASGPRIKLENDNFATSGGLVQLNQ